MKCCAALTRMQRCITLRGSSRSATSSALAVYASCSASEDIGLAYPLAVPIVKACVDLLQLGLPEAKFPLAEACILLATAPKSNSACMGIDAALADVRAGRTGSIPRELQNVHADGAGFEREQGYKYPHSYPGHWVRQQYLPYELRGAHYYDYGDNKTEQAAKRYGRRSRSNGHSGRRYPHNEKAHPCGSKQWQVLRTGADFKLRCCGCGHELMGARSKFEKRTSGRCSVELGLHSPLRRRLAVHRLDKRPRRPCRAARVRGCKYALTSAGGACLSEEYVREHDARSREWHIKRLSRKENYPSSSERKPPPDVQKI